MCATFGQIRRYTICVAVNSPYEYQEPEKTTNYKRLGCAKSLSALRVSKISGLNLAIIA